VQGLQPYAILEMDKTQLEKKRIFDDIDVKRETEARQTSTDQQERVEELGPEPRNTKVSFADCVDKSKIERNVLTRSYADTVLNYPQVIG